MTDGTIALHHHSFDDDKMYNWKFARISIKLGTINFVVCSEI